MEMFMIRIGNVNPKPIDKRRLSIWISPRDIAQLVSIGIDKPGIKFEIVYGISRNKRAWYDNSNAYRLGYEPQDDAESYAAEVLANEKPGGNPIAEMYQGGIFCAVEEVPNPAAPPEESEREEEMSIKVPAGACDTHMHFYDRNVRRRRARRCQGISTCRCTARCRNGWASSAWWWCSPTLTATTTASPWMRCGSWGRAWRAQWRWWAKRRLKPSSSA
jgi:hypothetical protein